MIRLTFVLRRKPELSREEFQEYWRTTHGPLVASHAAHLNILRYVQVHTLPDQATRDNGPRGPMEEAYDGVAELWFANREALVETMTTDEARRAGAELLEDEARFIDLPRSPLWFNHEYPQVNPTPENIVATPKSPIVKLHYPLRAPRDMDEEAAQVYWRTIHGPIIRSHAEAMGVLRYVQVHRYEEELETALRQARGVEVEPYMGHAELWYDRSQRPQTDEAARGGRAAVEDEANFIDFSRSTIFFGKELVFVDRRW